MKVVTMACYLCTIGFSFSGAVLVAVLAGLIAVPGWAQTSSPAASSRGYRIAGTLVSKADGRPLARAKVIVRDTKDAKNSQTLITKEDGKFEFNGLPAGKYSLIGSRRGFL